MTPPAEPDRPAAAPRAAIAGYEHRFEPGAPDAPVLLLLHGTGGDENDLIPLGRALWPGAALLAPRGTVLEHGAPRFFRRLAEGVFDLEDLAKRTRELGRFVREAVATYGLEGRPLVAAGFSNGANVAASLMLSGETRFAAAVLFRAMLPFEPERRPELSGVSVLLSSGRSDPIVPRESVERLARLLESSGAAVTLRWDEGAHGLGPAQVFAARDWLAALPLVGRGGRRV
jgi:predicted esterase